LDKIFPTQNALSLLALPVSLLSPRLLVNNIIFIVRFASLSQGNFLLPEFVLPFAGLDSSSILVVCEIRVSRAAASVLVILAGTPHQSEERVSAVFDLLSAL
jgi:hypothetical protein